MEYGGSSTLFGSGSLGSAILLENKADWNNKINTSYGFKGDSFGDFKNNLALKIGNKNIQYHLKGEHHVAENNFTYIDNYKVGFSTLRQRHNSSKNTVLIQKLFLRTKNQNHLELGLWLHDKKKEIPENMESFGENNQLQTEFTSRAYVKWKKFLAKDC